jgi:hypothetical protein
LDFLGKKRSSFMRSRTNALAVKMQLAAPDLIDELLTAPALANLMGLATPTIHNAIRRAEGTMAHIRTPGNQIRIRRRDALAYCHENGIAVPAGLVPRPADVMVLHTSFRSAHVVRAHLPAHCRVSIETDAVTGLIRLGKSRPSLVIISIELGIPLIARLCDALRDDDYDDYTALVVLQRRPAPPWGGGPLPTPLPVGDPSSSAPSNLRSTVSRLLGLGHHSPRAARGDERRYVAAP